MNFWERMQSERLIITELLLKEHESRYQSDHIEELPRQVSAFSIESIARDKACSFTGHRPEKLQRSYEECLQALCTAIMDAYDAGYRIFISGMARGIDLWAAHIVLVLRSFNPEIRLVAAIPFDGFIGKWNQEDSDFYHSIQSQADTSCIVTQLRAARSFQLRNVWMVDRSSRLIACWDGEPGGTANTIQYAKRMNKTIIMI